MQTYEEDYLETIEDLKEDGMSISLLEKGSQATDDYGMPVTLPDQSFKGYGLTKGFSAYYISNNFAKQSDTQLIFAAESQPAEYLDFIERVRKGTLQAYAVVNGKEWKILKAMEVKPTTVQIVVTFHLTE
jgi:hypothetical protein